MCGTKRVSSPVSVSVSLLLCISMPGMMLLSGCAGSFAPADPVENEQTPLGEIKGSAHGGNAPIVNAQIYVLAAGAGGYAAASASLIPTSKNGVNGVSCTGGVNGYCYTTTDQNGNFTVTADYTCTQGQQVYLVAVGGDPGLDHNYDAGYPADDPIFNSGIVQMAGLGQCPASGTMAGVVSYVVINEITTVAFAYAMGGFGTDAFHIAGSGTAQSMTGIANAMANANNIVGIAWGGALAQVPGNSNSVVPQSKIISLADIVATCVNTSSSTSSTCSSLFGDAKNSAGTKPTDEATALFNIAHNPTNNVTALWNLLPAQPVFTPTLSSAPTDWTLPVVYNSVTALPTGMAMDASGNVWISDSTNKAVVRVAAQGAVTSFKNGGSFGAIAGVAVNPSTGKIWASDSTNNKVYVLDPTSGTLLTTITGGTLNKPAGIAFDTSVNGFVVNSGAYSINEYN